MRFEAREVRSHTEFVRVTDLVVGKVYFNVTYMDYDMVVPEVVPLVFIGRDLHSDEAGLYFQDVESHARGEAFDPADWAETDGSTVDRSRPETVRFDVFEDDDEYSSVCDFDGMLDEILRTAFRRAARP